MKLGGYGPGEPPAPWFPHSRYHMARSAPDQNGRVLEQGRNRGSPRPLPIKRVLTCIPANEPDDKMRPRLQFLLEVFAGGTERAPGRSAATCLPLAERARQGCLCDRTRTIHIRTTSGRGARPAGRRQNPLQLYNPLTLPLIAARAGDGDRRPPPPVSLSRPTPLRKLDLTGGAAWDPGGAEWPAVESAGLRRRKAMSTSG